MRMFEIEAGMKGSFVLHVRQVWPDKAGRRAIAKEGKAHG
jgi:hypothetical protein